MADYHKGLAWYEETYFSQWSGEKAVGETSNSYMGFEPALERIARNLPDVKLTMTLRNPMKRSFIHWVHHHQQRRFTPEQRMQFKLVMDPHGWLFFRMWIDPSLYSLHLKRVYGYFPKDHVRVMFYDDLIEDPVQFIRGFFEFLEVDPDFRPSVLNTAIGYPNPERPDTEDGDLQKGFSDEVREELRQIFREDIEELEEMTGRDLRDWK